MHSCNEEVKPVAAQMVHFAILRQPRIAVLAMRTLECRLAPFPTVKSRWPKVRKSQRICHPTYIAITSKSATPCYELGKPLTTSCC